MGMSYDRTAQLTNAKARGYGAQSASLMAAGTPTRQHNLKTSKSAAKKTAAKKSTAKKTSAKKSAAKKTATKKA
jgi:hypothetical protein